jgi:hypothetical protein
MEVFWGAEGLSRQAAMDNDKFGGSDVQRKELEMGIC